MPKKRYDIDILEFLYSLSLEVFTVTDVTRHLLKVHTDTFAKKKDATQFAYRNLKLLEAQGVIKTLNKEDRKGIVFGWSNQTESAVQKQKLLHIEDSEHLAIVEKLQSKIRQCKAQMFTSLGETEAYSEWVAEMPRLAEDIEAHDQHAREQTKLMLGKMQGFERLLAQYQKDC